ncbi:hypothetical protein CSC70_10330 [Pseudoxanthomonas kalamensis DSM 18571]|nr:hypothetical protein CSC70_10330 [Pseudoxanthomonas kalamensis DSM 18571]
MLAAEQPRLEAFLRHGLPAQPWLWLGPLPAEGDGTALPPRGLRLQRVGHGLRGALDCRLPLPLAIESVGTVVIQHILDMEGMEALLAECARVLQPGGRLLMFALNPWSGYRLRWRESGLSALRGDAWRHRLQGAGLTLADTGRGSTLGPAWSVRQDDAADALRPWRAVNVFQAEKRTLAAIPPEARPYWQAGAAVA